MIVQETAAASIVWSASDQANAERLVDQAGTLNCNMGQRGGWIASSHPDPAYAISAGNQSKGGVFGSGRDSQDTFVTVAFKPSHFTRGKDGKPPEVAPPLSADSDKGDQDTVVCATGVITHALTTRAACEEDGTGRGNPIVPQAIAFHPTQDPISSQDGSCHAIGTGSSGGCATAAVAFSCKDSGLDSTEECSPTMRAMHHQSGNANAGGQLAVAFTKSKRAQSTTDDESWVPGEVSPTFNCFDQGDTRATTVVMGRAAMQVRRLSPTECCRLQGFPDPHCDITFRKKPAADGPKYRTDCLPSSGHGDTSHQGIGVMTPVPMVNMQGSKGNAVAQADGPSYTLNSMHGHDVHAIATPMAVRRLTPRECERLQGFPDDYTAIEYRKKPAADGPKYRALGNSMAVPCMWWIGMRIAKATEQE